MKDFEKVAEEICSAHTMKRSEKIGSMFHGIHDLKMAIESALRRAYAEGRRAGLEWAVMHYGTAYKEARNFGADEEGGLMAIYAAIGEEIRRSAAKEGK